MSVSKWRGEWLQLCIYLYKFPKAACAITNFWPTQDLYVLCQVKYSNHSPGKLDSKTLEQAERALEIMKKM